MLSLFVPGYALLQRGFGALLLRQGGLQSRFGQQQLAFGLLPSFAQRDLRRPGPIRLIDRDELLHQQRLDAMQVVVRVGPLGFNAADALTKAGSRTS